MANYAIALSFIKANTTVVRGVGLTAPRRYFALRNPESNFVVPPALDPGDSYVQFEGLTGCNFQINDTNQDFRLLGDDGWGDSVITGSAVQASCTGYFLKKIIPDNPPKFAPDYSPGFSLIQRARYDKNFEVYFEFLKSLGNDELGRTVYDFTGFNAVIMNYSENEQAEGLLEVSFDLMSRGRAIFGKYTETTGGLSQLKIDDAGSGYKPGTYTNAPVFGNDPTASGGTVDITVDANGVVTVATPSVAGSGYKQNEALSVDNSHLGGQGSGLRLLIEAVTTLGGNTPSPRVRGGGMVPAVK